MSSISNVRTWAEHHRPPEEAALRQRAEPDDALATLNSITLTQAQFVGGVGVVEALPEAQRWSPLAQALALQVYAAEAGLLPVEVASAAIAARLTAMHKWQALHDPERTQDPEHLIAAAAVAELCLDDSGVVFDAERFRELALFIAQLPF